MAMSKTTNTYNRQCWENAVSIKRFLLSNLIGNKVRLSLYIYIYIYAYNLTLYVQTE
jgi:hypothetical protein